MHAPAGKRRPTRFWFVVLSRLVLLAFSCLVALVLVELFMRWREHRATQTLLTDTSKFATIPSDIPGLLYTLRPGVTNEHAAFNRHGFNMAERPAQKSPGQWRIMIVGDSVTQGVGADQRDDAYPNRCENILRERLGRENLEVWNCGTGGHNVDQVFIMMSRVVTNYSPDVMIYGFCFNDYWGPSRFLGGQAAQPEGAGAVGRPGLLDRLKQLRTLRAIIGVYEEYIRRTRGYRPVYVDMKISYPSWIAMKDRILEMRDFCRAHGWPFAVSIVPMAQFAYVDDAKNLALHDLRSFLTTNGISFCDATPILRAHAAERPFIREHDHPNSRGYQLIAENLAGWILTNQTLYLPPP